MKNHRRLGRRPASIWWPCSRSVPRGKGRSCLSVSQPCPPASLHNERGRSIKFVRSKFAAVSASTNNPCANTPRSVASLLGHVSILCPDSMTTNSNRLSTNATVFKFLANSRWLQLVKGQKLPNLPLVRLITPRSGS